jgi:hypothetical protein
MNDMRRDGADTSSTVIPQRATGEKPQSLRDSLIHQLGDAVGEMMYAVEIEARRKTAERLRELQMRLANVNSQIESALQAHNKGLVPFQQAMDAAYARWLDACSAYEAEKVHGSSAVVPLRNEAMDLIREINQPHPHFSGKVKQWARPADYVEELVRPKMPGDPR